MKSFDQFVEGLFFPGDEGMDLPNPKQPTAQSAQLPHFLGKKFHLDQKQPFPKDARDLEECIGAFENVFADYGNRSVFHRNINVKKYMDIIRNATVALTEIYKEDYQKAQHDYYQK